MIGQIQNNYKKWISKDLGKDEKIEVMFFGHSLCESDRDVILDVISDLSAVSQQYAASTNGTIEAAQTMNDAMKAVENASQKLKNMSDDLTNELEIFKLS